MTVDPIPTIIGRGRRLVHAIVQVVDQRETGFFSSIVDRAGIDCRSNSSDSGFADGSGGKHREGSGQPVLQSMECGEPD